DRWGREEHDAAVHPPPEIIGRPRSGTVLKAPPGPALEAPRSFLTALEFPVLFLPLTPTFLGVGAHHRKHGARDHQAHANPLAHVPHFMAGSLPHEARWGRRWRSGGRRRRRHRDARRGWRGQGLSRVRRLVA